MDYYGFNKRRRRRRRRFPLLAGIMVIFLLLLISSVLYIASGNSEFAFTQRNGINRNRNNSSEQINEPKEKGFFARLMQGLVTAFAGMNDNDPAAEDADGSLSAHDPYDFEEDPPRTPIDSLEQKDKNTWPLILVNKNNPIPDDYDPKLAALPNGLLFDAQAIASLNKMLSDAKEQGLSPIVSSAYRDFEYQRNLFDKNVSQWKASGLNQADAEIEARKSVAYPGTSEHQTGLAVDIVSLEYQILDDKQADTPVAKWLYANCTDYGFILRYPKEKEEITQIVYEPWHFRYVGVTAAKEIMENDLCLEEYILYIKSS